MTAPTRLCCVESCSTATLVVDGRAMLSFGGSGYLGLNGQRGLIEAGVDALRRFGAHAQLGRHYGFALAANLDAEAEARRFFDVDGAMFFGTGYLFGLIAIGGLATRCDAVFIDACAHYSLRDAARASGRPMHEFAHRDAADLERAIARELPAGGRPLVATDGMFPTRGAIAPLADYAGILSRHDGWLVVDESHAFGTLGDRGRGAVEHAGLPRRRVVAGGSMAKAFGAHGGLAIGDAAIIEQLWTAPAARGAALGCSAGAAMSAASMRQVRANPALLARLRRNAQALRQGLRSLGLEIDEHDSPVVAVTRGSAATMQSIQARLLERDIFIAYSTYVGSGPAGVLRLAAFADHRDQDIQRLVDELRLLL